MTMQRINVQNERSPYEYPIVETHRLDGVGKQAFDVGRNRLIVAATVLSFAFLAVGYKLVDLTVLSGRAEAHFASNSAATAPQRARADVVDRNGVLLATSLPTPSLYADPAAVLDAEEAADKLAAAFPDMNRQALLTKLQAKGRFVWLRRNLSPQQQYDINRLGIPGVAFKMENRRVYPHGRLAAHVLGTTDVDGRGISGIEKYFDQSLLGGTRPLALSIDVRLQAILHQELSHAMAKFSAIGAAGLMKDVRTGEIVAMVSLPDFDANDKSALGGDASFNRATKGVYELGSSFKLFTAAMALDAGTVAWDGGYDATDPIRVARFTINDYHGKKRWLSVPEIIIYSSNIGAAKMAVDVGIKGQQRYLGDFGLLRPSAVELPETGHPLSPSPWREINAMTISYGHGIAVTPLHLATGISALVNGGIFRPATLLKQSTMAGQEIPGVRVITASTSERVRQLMRLVVTQGTGKNADAKGYLVGGKTGTADKQMGGRYREKSLISSFVAAFPMDAPRYVIMAMLDEPKGIKSTFNYATGGWVAAPVVKAMVERAASLLGIAPRVDQGEEVRPRILEAAITRRSAPTRASSRSVMTPLKVSMETIPMAARPMARPAVAESPRDRVARQTRAVLEQAVATR